MRRLFLAAVLLAGMVSVGGATTVVELHVDDLIQPITADYIVHGIDYAEHSNAQVVLLWLNTPGGLETSMRDIVDKIIHSRVPVIVYVAPSGARAASAGFYILLAADVAVMAPGTNTGAATPVAMSGAKLPDDLRNKIVSDAAAYLRSITAKRNRHPELAEKAVTEARSFTDKEALEAGLIDAVCQNRDELFAKFNGKTVNRFEGGTLTLALSDAQVERVEMTSRERFLSRILDPNIAFLLAIFGILGLYIEFTHPGLILPGVAGGIALLLALFALHLLPVNYTGVLLIVLALLLFALEAKYTSHGVLAIGGMIAMILGALMLINAPVPEMKIRFTTAFAVTIPFALITLFLVRLVIQASRERVQTGTEEMIGAAGVVRVPVTPDGEGQVFVHGEYWRAVAAKPVPVGKRVRIVRMEGLTLTVEPIEDTQPTETASPGKE